MKKILALILALVMVLTMVACGSKNEADETLNDDTNIEVSDETVENEDVVVEDKDTTDNKPEAKPEAKPEVKPETKPVETTKPETTPEVKPEEAPAAPTTLGTTLLADFKANASKGDTQAIADAIIQNPAILFMPVTAPVEEGLLQGFGNAEIKGFKSGTTFLPMIGSIAFVGYIFELNDAAEAPAFINMLKQNANLRWNICTEAEEMVTGSVGNKVFFLMCPKAMEE